MNKKCLIFCLLLCCVVTLSGRADNELSKIQNQIKQTEQQSAKIEQQIKTSTKNVEQTKKKLVRAADRVSELEEQRAILEKRIAELDAQRDVINAELKQSHDGISDATSSILYISANPNFNTATMHAATR